MFPIKYIDNNLVWNKDNEVFAYYELIRTIIHSYPRVPENVLDAFQLTGYFPNIDILREKIGVHFNHRF